ncbi:SRPBCC domain-containing protein [Rhodoferax sp. UBA5149]|uniref:SRPBCC domain-containing protein n=1 Tax=Rhodoferax sp. UBA5149 TaxID=1947379 RepID=UPI0025FC0710|nr:SRPBCC domain-containing protein [Rhodoferax sp. UBA5149]
MQVFLNTDPHVDGRHQMAEHLTAVVKDALGRFGEQITRVEAHLTDATSHLKATPDEIHCTLEARLVGLDPVVVKDRAGNAHQAIHGAVVKLKRAVATVLEKHDPRRNVALPDDVASNASAVDDAEPAMKELTAQVQKTIHASAPDVWRALTTPATLKKFFFGADVETDWMIGSPIRMKGEFKGKPYEDKGEVIAVIPQQLLSFSHWSALSGQADVPENYHVVSFQLGAQGTSTKVTLSQANLTGGVTSADVTHRADYEKNWSTVLDGLSKLFP